jgi:hypothetical protein
MASIVELVEECFVTDLKPVVIKLKRISLTTEQEEYCSKIKSAPKDVSDFSTDCLVTDLKTAVIKLKRISLTTEQKKYLSKIKRASDFQSEIEVVEEKIKNPYRIKFSKKNKQSEKENEEPNNFIEEQQPFACVYCEKSFLQVHEVKKHIKFCVILKQILNNGKDCVTKDGIEDTPTSPTKEINNVELTEKMLNLYDALVKQSETDPERDIIGPFMVKPCKETYPDYYRSVNLRMKFCLQIFQKVNLFLTTGFLP